MSYQKNSAMPVQRALLSFFMSFLSLQRQSLVFCSTQWRVENGGRSKGKKLFVVGRWKRKVRVGRVLSRTTSYL